VKKVQYREIIIIIFSIISTSIVVGAIVSIYIKFCSTDTYSNRYQGIFEAIIGCVSSLIISLSIFLANKIQVDVAVERQLLSIQPILSWRFDAEPNVFWKRYVYIKNITNNPATNVIVCHDLLLGTLGIDGKEKKVEYVYKTDDSPPKQGVLEIKVGGWGPYDKNDDGIPKYVDIIYNDLYGNHYVQIYVCEKYGISNQYELAVKPFIRETDRFLDYAPSIIKKYHKKRKRMARPPKHKYDGEKGTESMELIELKKELFPSFVKGNKLSNKDSKV